MNRYKLAITLILGFWLSNEVYAQHFSLEINHAQGFAHSQDFELFSGGKEIRLSWYIPTEMKYHVLVSGAYRSIQWGNQLNLNFSALIPVKSLEFQISGLMGMALFHNRPLFATGLEARTNFILIKKEKTAWGLSAGISSQICPAYKNYSKIYTAYEMPLGVLIRF